MRVASILLFLGLTACNQPQADAPVPGAWTATGDVLLTVNDKELRSDLLDVVTERLPPGQLDQMKAQGQYREFVENIAVGQELYGRAIAAKLHEDPDVQRIMALAMREILAGEMVQKEAEKAVGEEAVQAAYDAKKVQFLKPAVRARHVLVDDEALSTEIHAKLAAGEDFEALATAHSKDKGSAARGGDLGWLNQGKTVPVFNDAIFNSSPEDTLLAPFNSRFGWHIVEVTGRRDATPLEEVREQLESGLKQEAIESLLETVRSETTIVWKEEVPVAEADDHAGHDHEAGAH